MKMMKRLAALALCLALICSVLPGMSLTAHAETLSGSCGAEGAELNWTLDTATGVLTISGSGAMADYDGVGVFAPWYEARASVKSVVLQEGVTSVGQAAFFDCDGITSVSLSASLIAIGADAFNGCAGLNSVALPANLIEIGMFAFAKCTGLTELTVPESVTEIGQSAFTACTGLSTVNLPEGLESLGMEAFYGCTGLTAVTLPVSMSNVSQGCFGLCTELTTVSFPEGLAVIGAYAFDGCSKLTGVTFPESLIAIGKRAFRGCAALTELSFPANLGQIDEEAFIDCTGLHTVQLQEGIAYLSERAFANCAELSSIEIPASLVNIDPSALSGCLGLQEINVADGNPNFRSQDGVLYNSAMTVLILHPARKADASYTVPAGVTRIENEAFRACDALTEVQLPESLTSVGWYAFLDCPNMLSVKIPETVTAIDAKAFGYVSDGAGGMAKVEGFTIYGAAVSVAHTYADENGFRFSFGNPFEDVQEDDYFFTAVMWALERGVTAGLDDTHFGPNDSCIRAQIVTFLWKALDTPKPSSQYNPFLDVRSDNYFYKPVLWAVEMGITAGVGDQLFGAAQSCTRAQAMTFLWRAKGSPEPSTTDCPFSDVSSDQYFYKPVLWAVENGITAGMGDGSFGADAICTRAQIITFLYKTFSAE